MSGKEMILMAFGGVCILGAICDWDWIFESSQAEPFVSRFGRNGARLCYFAFGLGFCALSYVIYKFL